MSRLVTLRWLPIVSRLVAAATVVLLAGLVLGPKALADADPASDVLLGQNVFYPYNPPVSSTLQAELNGETAAAHKARFPIKVALIASPFDLGALSTLFGRPAQYASFLDQEISFATKVPLLVVMPSGYGTEGLSHAGDAVVASLAKPSGRSGNALAQAAIDAVRKIATAAAHHLPSGAARGSSGGTRAAVPLTILAAICATLAAAIVALRHRRMTLQRHRRSGELGRRR